MTRRLCLAVIAGWMPSCAMSFEPAGLGGDDATVAVDSGADATLPLDAGPETDAGPIQDAEPKGDATPIDGAPEDGSPGDVGDAGPGDAAPGDASDVGVEVVITLGMSGATDAWFHSDPTGLDCLGSGRFSVPYATVWEVEAAASPTRVFNRWTRGPCNTSTVSVCRFTADQDLTLRADYNQR